MIVAAVGIPSVFSELCETLISQILVRQFGGPSELLHGNTPAEIGSAILGGCQPNSVLRIRAPTRDVREMLAASTRPVFAIVENPLQSFASLTADFGFEFLRSLHWVTLCNSHIAAFRELAEPFVIERPFENDPDFHAIARFIAGRLGFSLGDGALDECVDAAKSHWHLGPPDRWRRLLKGRNFMVMSEALAGLHDIRAGTGKVVWHRDLFLIPDRPTERAVTAIDLTGPPRPLLLGPSYHLPPGNWRGRLMLGFSQEATEMPFSITVATGSQTVRTTIQPTRQGVHEFAFWLSTRDVSDVPVEISVASERAAIDGRIAVGFIEFLPIGAGDNELETEDQDDVPAAG